MNGKIICASIIKQRRKELGMTQAQLAEKLYVTNKAVSKWETGDANPDISLLLPLAKALNISVDELLGNTEQNDKSIPDEPVVPKTSDRIKYIICIIGIIPSVIISFFFLISAILAFDSERVAVSTGNANDKGFLILFSSFLMLIFAASSIGLIIKIRRLNELFTEEKSVHLRKLAREKGCVLLSDLPKEERNKLSKDFNRKYIVLIICWVVSPFLIPISAMINNPVGIAVYILGIIGFIACRVFLNVKQKAYFLKQKIYYR